MTEITAEKIDKGAAANVARAEAQRAAELEALAAAEYQAPGELAPGQGIAGAPPVQDQGPDNGELAGSVVLVLFELVAARAGDHWRVTPAEAQAWGAAAGPVLDKYLGRGNLGPEVTLVAATLGLLVPRVLVSRSVRRDRGDQGDQGGDRGDKGDKAKGDQGGDQGGDKGGGFAAVGARFIDRISRVD